MIATHMDAIGLMVSRLVDGLLHVEEVGGVDPRILPGTPVIVHGRRALPGVVAMPPVLTLPEDKRKGAAGAEPPDRGCGACPPRPCRTWFRLGTWSRSTRSPWNWPVRP